MVNCSRAVWVVIAVGLMAVGAAAAPPEAPKSLDGSVKVSLFAGEPDIVTPIGATVDTHGRLLVIESNTHFRPKDYKGPPTDRILILQSNAGSSAAEKISTFYEDGKYLMNVEADRDGSVLVSSRNEIFRLIDGEGKGVSTQKISIARLETKADYPHNGLHGLAIDRDENIYFSIGENFGGAYTLEGNDGRKISDDKGCGSVFRVDAKGNHLTLIARGFWNPFGLGVDPAGNVWLVDNDPDGRPPCRLIHVLPGADYGYEWRYGRTGLHPLQGWDGELPGTLGMVAGVGEAPCAVKWHDGFLYVTSWRDHHVQRFALTPRGASYSAAPETVVAGGQDFRPTGIAFAPDGVIFVNDWGSASYNVNRKGHIWKLSPPPPASASTELKPTPAMEHAAALRKSKDVRELVAAMDDVDPAMAQAAQFGLSQRDEAEKIEWSSLPSSRQRIGLLAALMWRGSNLQPYVAAALKDPDDRVRQMGVRCITEQQLTDSRAALEQLLSSESLSPRLLGMTVAAIGLLNGDKTAKVDPAKINSVLMSRLNSNGATDQAKAVAMHMMLATHPRIAIEDLRPLLASPTAALKLESVRYLNDDTAPARLPLLAQLAADVKADTAVRAEATIGLGDDAAAQTDLLLKLAADRDPAVRQEALRSLRPVAAKLSAPQREQLAGVAKEHADDVDLVARLTNAAPAARPAELDIAGWQKIVDAGAGDPDTGRRIFFNPNAAGCYHCHMVEGRGHAIGPDLSKIAWSQTRDHVLESILDPSREVAPLFVLWTITVKGGDKVEGMLLRRDGQSNEVYVDSAGKETTVKESTVIDRKMRKESLMPNGLVQGLTDQELRDLIAYLMEKR